MKKIILLFATSLMVACVSSVEEKNNARVENKNAPTLSENHSTTDKKINNTDNYETDEIVSAAEPEATREYEAIVVTGGRVRGDGSIKRKPHVNKNLALMEQSVTPTVIDRENYHNFKDNPVKRVTEQPVSTFSVDVDTGAYSNVRRFLNQGQKPRQDAVRLEEMVNYFSYNYPKPDRREQPFSTYMEVAPSPWNKNAHLLHIGIQGYEIEKEDRPDANLVFLIDVSGSMSSPDKLGLLKSSLKLLAKNMRASDKLAIAVYAGAAGTVLEPTSGSEKNKIMQSLDGLNAGGSTNGAAGIHLAYQLAEQNMVKDGINRIIIATDGDFNVGTTNFEALKELIEEKRKTGISLTTLGFGTGNYNDHLMEQLADVGNGNHAYIDSIREANKVLINEMNSTLFTIAKDVKIQVEFNPEIVSEYRLIGYENRVLKNEDFNNDKIDAGEIGAGHTVTALYELILKGSDKGWLEPLKYQKNAVDHSRYSNEMAEVRIRYKQPNSNSSQLLKWSVDKSDIKDSEEASENFQFSSAVAAFGQLLRGGKMVGEFDYNDVLALSKKSKGADPFGYRGEFIQLVSLADNLFE